MQSRPAEPGRSKFRRGTRRPDLHRIAPNGCKRINAWTVAGPPARRSIAGVRASGFWRSRARRAAFAIRSGGSARMRALCGAAEAARCVWRKPLGGLPLARPAHDELNGLTGLEAPRSRRGRVSSRREYRRRGLCLNEARPHRSRCAGQPRHRDNHGRRALSKLPLPSVKDLHPHARQPCAPRARGPQAKTWSSSCCS